MAFVPSSATSQPKRSFDAPSTGVNLARLDPVVRSKRKAEPEEMPLASSDDAAMSATVPEISIALPKFGKNPLTSPMSLPICCPVVRSKTYTAPLLCPGAPMSAISPWTAIELPLPIRSPSRPSSALSL